MRYIAPSLLSADFSRLREEVADIEQGGADWLHLDVMDGHFVPNITFGPGLVKALRPHSKLFFDVHLMVEEPGRFLSDYAAAGADLRTVHFEACRHLHRVVQQIKALGLKAGVALNPATPPEVLQDILPELDLVLIMSVNPGFGGQSFIPAALGRIARTAAMLRQIGSQADLEVDGGIYAANAGPVMQAGANVLVSGTGVFGQPDWAAAIAGLRSATEK